MFSTTVNQVRPTFQYLSCRSSSLLALQSGISDIIKFGIENKEAISLLSPLMIYAYTKLGAYRRANNARILSAVKQARKGVPPALEEILKTANPHLCDSNGNTLMHFAVREGNRELANTLVTYGASPDALNRYKQTPFYEAVFAGQDEIVEDMIRLNQNRSKRFFYDRDIVNQKTYSGWTPILAAILNRRTAVISTLITHDADLFVKNDKGESALQLAVENNDVFLVEFILNNSHLNNQQVMALIQHQDHGRHGTPLYIAAKKGFVKIVELLVNRGALNTPTGKRGFTPLHIAILRENEQIIRLLIEKGALSSLENEAISIIDCIILKGIQRGYSSAIEKEILKRYFSNSSHTQELYKLAYLPFSHHFSGIKYRTPASIHEAIFWNDQHAVRAFLQSGVNIEEKNANGETPLFLAGFYNHRSMAEMLIEKGADIHCTNCWGESFLHCLIINNDLKLAQLLCEKGINLRYVDSQGYSYLHHVVKYGSTKMAFLLLEKGAMRDPRTQNFGNTPLHLAAMLGKIDMVTLLLFRYRADPSGRNSCDLTPSQLAKDNQSILALLELAQEIQCEADLYAPKLKNEILKILRDSEEELQKKEDIFTDPVLESLIYRQRP